MSATRIVRCPACGKQVEWIPENRYRPFCSERCRLMDLGAWANERYRIPEAERPSSPAKTPRDPQ